MRQALGNPMSIAVRHTPPGGTITPTAHRAPRTAHRTGDDAIIQVADTGSGIEPKDLSQVFDRFWRAEKSRSRHSGGGGLGLSIVRQLVEAHGGTVCATSVPGTETVFSPRLPAGSQSAGPQVPRRETRAV
ncbi:ATP-binding protein [Streptomyces scopuliridis]|uniref:ATP-binding protein n=1 Tax=Streptomyces scopuliridis TaxID=452529 RepID=UPI0036B680D7